MTFEFHEVNGVKTDGTAGATEMPMDPEPIKLGQPVSVVAPELIQPIQQLNNTLPELPQILPKPIEVAVYRVSFNDLDENGQAEQSELPKSKDVENAQDVDADQFDEKEAVKKKGEFFRAKIDQLKSETGGTASPQDIDNFKAKFLNDPEQTSGAYSIIQKEGDKTTVLETFSLRDWPEQEPVNQPVIQPKARRPARLKTPVKIVRRAINLRQMMKSCHHRWSILKPARGRLSVGLVNGRLAWLPAGS